MKIFILILSISIFLNAHKLNLLIENQNKDFIKIKSFYMDEKSCRYCEIIIKDKENNIIKRSKTDENGEKILKINREEIANIEVKDIEHKISANLDYKSEDKEKPYSFKFLIAILAIILIFFILYKLKK